MQSPRQQHGETCAIRLRKAMRLSRLTLEAYMDQQAVDVAIERRALSNHANVRFLKLKEVLAICGKSQ
jgi:hypothetical protein